MGGLEENIREFARKAGARLTGIAGPERLSGPPSLNPTYTMPGAKSVVSLVLPMNVPSIYDFLGKKSSGPHNIDQARMNQQIHRIAKETADYIVNLGYRAKAVPANNTYRRALDPFCTRPSFSHRFAAVVSGLGTFGLSGNVVTREFGAAVYLGSLVTDAVLKSDPVLPARQAMDGRCRTCKLCDKSCTLRMFEDNEEEHLLLNGELHARGKRNNVDFCNLSCFGLHAISQDKKWSNWGRHVVNEWLDNQPDPKESRYVRGMLMRQSAMSGDSTPRFEVIRRIGARLWPREEIEDFLPAYENLPAEEKDICDLLVRTQEKLGVFGLKDPYVLTCGQCALVCGPDYAETKRRYDLLTQSGFVVPGPDGRMVRVATLEEYFKMKERYPAKVDRSHMANDAAASGSLWMRSYFGIEPKGEIQNALYQARNRKACTKAGLAGKEARPLYIGNPSYLLSVIMPKKKRRR
jgi:epoxyqueuosine reductase QueG